MSIGPDALPWRFNRDMSYVRRPLVLQGDELVFGFRSILGTGPILAVQHDVGPTAGQRKNSIDEGVHLSGAAVE